MWRSILKAILGVYIAWSAWHWYADRPVRPPDGILAKEEPRQTNIVNGGTLQMGHWALTVRADYQITARVLGRESYHFDGLADLIPEDLALGWGPMSDNRNLQTIEISQSNRFYYWHASAGTAIGREMIITHSANTHVIPQDSLIARQLARLRTGEVVTLRGELVDGLRNDGRWIKTSMVRDDTGPGACEVLLVTEIGS